MRLALKLGCCMTLLLLCGDAMASELAILHNGFSISHERHEVIGEVTRLYMGPDMGPGGGGYVDVQTSQIDHFEQSFTAAIPAASAAQVAPAAQVVPAAPVSATAPSFAGKSAPSVGDAIASASDRHHLDPDLVSSVIHAESAFNPRALSPKGAQGLMQLMPQTAMKLGVTNAFDPKSNVEGGTQYLRSLLEQYHFDLVKALAAYNAGPGRVAQYGGVPPYYETQAYVARIVRDFNRKKVAQKKAALAAKTARTPTKHSSAETNLTHRASR
jgi:soluble lytic murein transglycosylase-like protein